MVVHGIKTFQERTDICEDFYCGFVAVLTDNLLGVGFHESGVDLRIAAVSCYCVSADCYCIDISALFIESHIEFVCHVQFPLMGADFLIECAVHWSAFEDHDQADHGFAGRKAPDYCYNCPDGHSGLEVDPGCEEDK